MTHEHGALASELAIPIRAMLRLGFPWSDLLSEPEVSSAPDMAASQFIRSGTGSGTHMRSRPPFQTSVPDLRSRPCLET